MIFFFLDGDNGGRRLILVSKQRMRGDGGRLWLACPASKENEKAIALMNMSQILSFSLMSRY